MTLTPADTVPKPRRRWLRFSLRTLLLLMVPVACVAAWLGVEFRQADRQRDAIAWIEENGGTIEFHDASRDPWLRRIFGERLPRRVRVVDLNPLEGGWFVAKNVDTRRADEIQDLYPLTALVDLEEIHFSHTNVSDLSPLAELPYLKTISAVEVPVRDLQPLAQVGTLRRLEINGRNIDDFSPLMELPHLEHLDLGWCPHISDEQLLRLQQTVLHCEITVIRDVVLEEL